ncbi:hypothetical protein K438DRAFT_1578002 [Mycena galopus ATCC 62051]|nr:hypothetical protein K438DRAFT_1578002 [Mycena galopus ATCC 62051]
MPEIPTELVLYIASFLSNDELLKLVGVNIHFYNLALDLRYSNLLVETLDDATEKLLRRLRCIPRLSAVVCCSPSISRDPIPASRVRRLAVRPKVAKRPMSPTLLQKLYAAAARRQTIIDALIPVFAAGGFTSLECFEVESWALSPEYDMQSFFRSAWSAFGRQLEAIFVAGRLETLRQFVASDPQLVSCTALSLQLTSELTPLAAVDGILVNSLAPFINGLAPHLRALKIVSWSTLDLSALFLNLDHFPHLHDFHLRAPFNLAFSNPTGLTALLERHSPTLDIVQLRLNPAGSAMDPNSEQPLSQWFASHRANPAVFANLKRLRLYPTNLDSGFYALLMYIERSAHSLTTLVVQDRYLVLDEIAALITPLSHRAADEGLQTLHLNVRVWNVELFDLIALKLPGLKNLSLYIGGSHPHGREATELFFTELQTHSFIAWGLRDIGVWQGGSEVSSRTMRLLAKCIPSVQSFWGNGNMLDDSKVYPRIHYDTYSMDPRI